VQRYFSLVPQWRRPFPPELLDGLGVNQNIWSSFVGLGTFGGLVESDAGSSGSVCSENGKYFQHKTSERNYSVDGAIAALPR